MGTGDGCGGCILKFALCLIFPGSWSLEVSGFKSQVVQADPSPCKGTAFYGSQLLFSDGFVADLSSPDKCRLK